MNWFTKIFHFHKHSIVYTSRKLIGYEKKFTGKLEQLQIFNTKQPYDEENK